VRRGENRITIVAGYPWFTDWGRDTMIALPGLCLVTGRVEEGGEILSTFAAHVKDGLLPNHFPDAGEEPEYNTLDASLWFFQAIRQYLAAGGRPERVRRDLYPAGRQILEAYQRGTRTTSMLTRRAHHMELAEHRPDLDGRPGG
jgi:predicted glycogen debranching enzyme